MKIGTIESKYINKVNVYDKMNSARVGQSQIFRNLVQ